MKRRDVLELLSTAAGASGFETASADRGRRTDPAPPSDVPRSPTRERLNRGFSADSVSLRELARRMDFAVPARRLRGNGPPVDGRSGVSAEDMATYQGEVYVDFPRASREHAYDLGMINRFDRFDDRSDGVVERTDLSEKGLLESHRFADPGSEQSRSVRTVVDRHVEGTIHRCLWLNTRLVGSADNNDFRDRKIGELVGGTGYDIAGFAEVYDRTHADELRDHYAEAYGGSGSPDSEYGPVDCGRDCSGLLTVVGDDRGGRRRIDPNDTRMEVYDEDPCTIVLPTDWNEGFQRVKIDVDLGDAENAAFDLFITHLDAKETNCDRKRRRKQVDILTDAIETRQAEARALPKIVMGDMNIWSHRRFDDDELIDYEMLLEKMDDVGMQSAWLTHGGPAGAGAAPRNCTVLDHTPRASRWRCHSTCYCDPFDEGNLTNNRIDYVFVEKPRERHAINLDLSRMWHVPLDVDDCDCLSRNIDRSTGDATVDEGPALSDHPGIGFDLLTSPK